MMPTAQQVRKSALRFLLVGAGIILGVLVVGSAAGIGAHDSGFVFVLCGELLGLVLIGISGVFLLLSFFFRRATKDSRERET
jgi:hypothetical protein